MGCVMMLKGEPPDKELLREMGEPEPRPMFPFSLEETPPTGEPEVEESLAVPELETP
jgi:hypothetical protein